MKKTIIASLLILTFTPIYPQEISHGVSIYGERGILRLLTGRPTKKGNLIVNLHTEYRTDKYTVVDPPDTFESKHNYAKEHIGVTYGAVDWLEFSILTNLYLKYDGDMFAEEPRGDVSSVGLDDIEIGIKVGTPLFENPQTGMEWSTGIQGYLSVMPVVANAEKESTLVDRGMEPFLRRKPGGGFRVMSDFILSPLALNLSFKYFATGEFFENEEEKMERYNTLLAAEAGGWDIVDSTKLFHIPRNNISWGVGVRIFAGPHVEFFTEYTGTKVIDQKVSPLNAMYITPGIRFKTLQGVTFEFACDFGVSEGSKSWNAIVGLSVASSLIPPPPPPAPPPPPPPEIVTATIAGTVTDAETGDPLLAQITFPEEEDIESAATDPKTGFYEIELEPGKYLMEVRKKGYKWKRATLLLKDGEEKVLDLTLTKKEAPPVVVVVVEKGTIFGKVYDAMSQAPLLAQISFPETEIPRLATDPATGTYKIELNPGTYTMKVEVDGYTPAVEPIAIKAKETVITNFSMTPVLKKETRLVISGINFDSGKSTIKPISYPILDEAARILKNNPNVKIEIGGHTDSVGSESLNMNLSFARANAVRQYLISRHGIDPNRLVARGYGESMPIAPNTTREGRAQNRRIEFMALSE